MKTRLTENGKRLVEKICPPVKITRVAFGDGWYQIRDGVPIRKTALVNEKISFPITKYTYEDGIYTITFLASRTEYGFYIRENGLFALDEKGNEILFAYGADDVKNLHFPRFLSTSEFVVNWEIVFMLDTKKRDVLTVMIKICPVCHQRFKTNYADKIYCGLTCRHKARKVRDKAHRALKIQREAKE